MGELLRRDGYSVSLLPSPSGIASTATTSWLGVPELQDAEETIEAIGEVLSDWLIVDHYGLSKNWESSLRRHTRNLLVIDDIPDRSHDCNLLLDPNFSLDRPSHIARQVSSDCRNLLGPRFALLNPAFADRRRNIRPCADRLPRVLVFFGGIDDANVTGMTIDALTGNNLARLEVDVVVGLNNIHRDSIRRQCVARPNTTMHGHVPHLAELMANAGLAIGAGGGTTWERMCMGLPSVVIGIAPNQYPACEALAACGLVKYLGPARGLDSQAIEAAISDALADSGGLSSMAVRGSILVDGKGALRVAESLSPTKEENLNLRRANENDASIYYAWVNDAAVRLSAIDQDPIEWDAHLRWFQNRLNSPDCYLFVLEAGDLPVGQVRFEVQDGHASIDYSLDVLVRARGWAKTLLRLGIKRLDESNPAMLRAVVRHENVTSAAVFRRLGFSELISDDDKNDIRIFSLHSSQLASTD